MTMNYHFDNSIPDGIVKYIYISGIKHYIMSEITHSMLLRLVDKKNEIIANKIY